MAEILLPTILTFYHCNRIPVLFRTADKCHSSQSLLLGVAVQLWMRCKQKLLGMTCLLSFPFLFFLLPGMHEQLQLIVTKNREAESQKALFLITSGAAKQALDYLALKIFCNEGINLLYFRHCYFHFLLNVAETSSNTYNLRIYLAY